MRKVSLLALLLMFLTCTTEEEQQVEPKDVVDLVPLSGEISGWNKSSAMQVADTDAGLEAIINGEAVTYIDNGFVKGAFQDYTGQVGSNPVVDLHLRIFDHGDTTDAKAIYDVVAEGDETPWTDQDHAGVEARYKLGAGVTDYYILEFWEDKFYTYIYIGDGTTAALDVAKLFGLNISAAISDTTQGG